MTRDELMAELRALVDRAGNDFSWSGWDDTADALAELDELAEEWRRTDVAPYPLRTLFLPTGALQELALSSGWGEAYLRLAHAFDEIVDHGG